MNIRYEHRDALQSIVTAYWHQWIVSSETELPDWFYVVLDFIEVECNKRFNVVTGIWEDA